jgi:REP element-mobilizing transposase RayT
MRALRRSSHNVYQIHYHFVTPIKYRKGVFEKPEREQALRSIIKGFEERFEIWIEQVGVDRNHAHWLVCAAPKYAPSEIIRTIKSVTARELFRACPDLKKEMWGGELWSDGFFVATVGEGGSRNVILDYVERQGKKARRNAGQLKLFEP